MCAAPLHQLPDDVSPQSFQALDYSLQQFPDLSEILNGNGSIYAQTVGPEHERSIICLSPRMSRVMDKCKEVFTSMMEICAEPPNQHHKLFLYQVSCIVHDRVISLMLAIMQTPTYEAFRFILSFLQEFRPAFKPMVVNIPYSQNEMGVWEEVFHCVTQFTFTSYLMAVSKQFIRLGLTNVMATDHKVRSLLWSFLSIPLLPHRMMRRGFMILARKALLSAHAHTLNPFIRYYCDTWMKGAKYETLSVYNLSGNRLSDASDVAMRELKKETNLQYPSILHLINAVRQYEWSSYVSFRRARRGLPVGRARKVSNLRKDTVIQDSIAQLVAEEMSIKKFLRVTSTHVMGVL